ncbi:hypothetical protein V8F06_014279 [Rhypophila decipiens]
MAAPAADTCIHPPHDSKKRSLQYTTSMYGSSLQSAGRSFRQNIPIAVPPYIKVVLLVSSGDCVPAAHYSPVALLRFSLVVGYSFSLLHFLRIEAKQRQRQQTQRLRKDREDLATRQQQFMVQRENLEEQGVALETACGKSS